MIGAELLCSAWWPKKVKIWDHICKWEWLNIKQPLQLPHSLRGDLHWEKHYTSFFCHVQDEAFITDEVVVEDPLPDLVVFFKQCVFTCFVWPSREHPCLKKIGNIGKSASFAKGPWLFWPTCSLHSALQYRKVLWYVFIASEVVDFSVCFNNGNLTASWQLQKIWSST